MDVYSLYRAPKNRVVNNSTDIGGHQRALSPWITVSVATKLRT